jgi:mannitol-specific phosphotransferase system IIBC component
MHDVNLLAVLVAGIVPMIIGALWYGPLFGKRWMELMETTEEELREGFNPVKTHGVSFVLSLITAYVLAQLVAEYAGGAMIGVHVGLLALIAFVLPVTHQTVAFEGRKTGLAWLHFVYNGVSLVAQAVVIASWR